MVLKKSGEKEKKWKLMVYQILGFLVVLVVFLAISYILINNKMRNTTYEKSIMRPSVVEDFDEEIKYLL